MSRDTSDQDNFLLSFKRLDDRNWKALEEECRSRKKESDEDYLARVKAEQVEFRASRNSKIEEARAVGKAYFEPAFPTATRSSADIDRRIQQLRDYLNPTHESYKSPAQHANIKKALELYQTGYDGWQTIFLHEGKLAEMDEVWEQPNVWQEGVGFALSAPPSQAAYGPSCLGRDFHETSSRFIPSLGGNWLEWPISAINDTGSSTLLLFKHELPLLGEPSLYQGWLPDISVMNANGNRDMVPALKVQVKMCHRDGSQWTPWIPETAIVRTQSGQIPRLTGAGIRRHLYFRTRRGNDFAGVAGSSTGLYGLLR